MKRSIVVAGVMLIGCSGADMTENGDAGTRRDGSLAMDARGMAADGTAVDGAAVDVPATGADVLTGGDANRDVSPPMGDVNCTFRDELDFRTPVVGDCLGRAAERVFRRAICSCTEITINGGMGNGVFSFDSRMGEFMPNEMSNGASIAANESITLNGGSIVAGSVTTPGNVSANASTIRGDVIAGGTVSSAMVGRDVYAGGNVNSVQIARNLVQSPAGSTNSTTVGGSHIRCAVTVAPPCACQPAQIINVASFIADAAMRNDNMRLNFNPNIFSMQDMITLPAGRLYVPELPLAVNKRIRVTGATQLYVQRGVFLAINSRLEVEGDGMLDIFVGEDFTINGSDNQFGHRLRPSRARMYVARNVTINGTNNTVSANVYAPNSRVVLNGVDNTLFGSIFAQAATLNGANRVIYDTSISAASLECPNPDPMPMCSRCTGCDGFRACVNGRCGDCRTDADCCQPLVCYSGRCLPFAN